MTRRVPRTRRSDGGSNDEGDDELVRERDLVAEVRVQLLDDAGSWSPALSVDDATRLDQVREALRTGNLRRAADLAEHVYRLTPLTIGDVR